MEPEVGGCWRGGEALAPGVWGTCLCSGSEGNAHHREEKEFGFRGTEGRLLLLQACGLRIQVAQDYAVSGKAHLDELVTVPSFVTTPETPLPNSSSLRSSTSRWIALTCCPRSSPGYR